MASLRIMNSNGSPASCLRVIIKCPGAWGYGLTDAQGRVEIPSVPDEGTVIIQGETVFMGQLSGIIYLP
ncbi:MAG: hypothetical protein AAF696_13080 [Bacteroidota bacterium]